MLAKASTRVLYKKALLGAVSRPSASQAWQLTTPVSAIGKYSSAVGAKSCDPYYAYLREVMSNPSLPPMGQQARLFSAMPAIDNKVDNVDGNFENLNTSVIQKIKKDLQIVDENRDGQMQPEEFRKLLEMHRDSFTEHEIDLLTESFYSGTGARGVSFDRFLEALDIAASKNADKNAIAEKLGIDARGAEYILGSKTHAYTDAELDIELTHKPPEGLTNKLSFQAVRAVRYLFDLGTGWRGEITTSKVMNRVIYLETIAAVPGMVAGVIRHFKSLRAMTRDGGMLNMFLEEALNERMHLLTFIKMKNPGMILRGAVLGGQIGFGTFYGLAYIISPKFCHSFVGYVEEE